MKNYGGKKMGKEEGEIKDLVEKLKRGELTKKEVLVEMEKRQLFHHAGEPIPGIFAIIGIIAWSVLCFLPFILAILNFGIPEVMLESIINIPPFVSYILIFFALAIIPLVFPPSYIRKKWGGSDHEDETIILVKKGPYRIVRHPNFLGIMWFIVLPIILNSFANEPFTMFTFLGEIVLIIGIYLQVKKEERFNMKKWGDEYRQYMKEVPRFNFIKGLWNLRKRRG
jgi:protein-S-isoprenylcysteine O-methyltransferase Ste14